MLFFRGPSRKQTETLREVLERMEEIERGFKRMRLEWEDAFDKLQGVAQRVAKRAQRVEELANREHEEAEAPDAEASALGPENTRCARFATRCATDRKSTRLNSSH